MGGTVEIPVLPELSAIDFSSTSDVRTLIVERFHHLFGPLDDDYIGEYMDAIEDLFAGRHPGYQAMDTACHDITHTLQATLCLVELLHLRHFSEVTPRLDAEDFKRALIAVLFHDIGYLKTVDDTQGSGAKYTHLHEQRSCDFARTFLAHRGWTSEDICFVEHLISCTGPRADITRIEFHSEIEHILGQAVCTADYIGQMSDPLYPLRLNTLFKEFVESYQYQQIPQEEWPFASYEALLRSTPAFWDSFVQHKLNIECAGLWACLEHPVTGENLHMESIKRNLATIQKQIAALED
jgi:hypothetical protein